MNEEDARTATSLVCRELPADAAASGFAYRVDLDKLGTSIFISVVAESNGQTVDSRRMKLSQIEEAAAAAPRLVEALVNHKVMADTEKLGNLTTTEVASPARKYGQFQVGVGVLGAFVPGIATFSPGAELALRYDTPHWVLVAPFRFAVTASSDESFGGVQFGVGARYMLGLDNISPFVGGGMAIDWFHTNRRERTYHVSRDGGGVGFYGEVGLEVMRLHRNRLDFAVRADAPTFAVEGDYLMPVSLTTSFVFD